MKSPYQSFIQSRFRQIFLVSLVLSVLGTITFYTSTEEIKTGFILLWFFFMLAASMGFLLLFHTILFFLFGRHIKQD
jgi:hypothetical protein